LQPRIWSAQPRPTYTASNIQYEHSDRVPGLESGGIGAMHRLAQQTGLRDAIDRHVEVLKVLCLAIIQRGGGRLDNGFASLCSECQR
jgi:hypothetical protein